MSIPPFTLNFTKGDKLSSDEEILAELRNTTAGLFFMSESDYPVEVIKWDRQTVITPEYLRSISTAPAGSEVRETDLINFFSSNGKFQNVLRLLKNNLTDLKVYKVGTINIPVYVVGRSREGNWLGISTRVVES